MKISDLTANLSSMTEDQLMEHVRKLRHNKYVAKPAVAKRVADEEKAEKNTAIRGVNRLLDSMTPEQKAELLKKLTGGA